MQTVKPSPNNIIPLDKIRGSLAGGMLGDALGAPHEFKSNKPLPYTGRLVHKTEYHGRFMPAGQYTDDTEVTLALIWSLVEQKEYNPQSVALNYIEWANSGTYMMGNNTKFLFKGITAQDPNKRIETFTNKYRKQFDCDVPWTTSGISNCVSEKAKNAQSNGSLMRCSPLALFPDNIPAWLDCQLTNPNRVNLDASFIYLDAMRLAYYGSSKEDIIATIRDTNRIQTSAVRDVIDLVIQNKDRNLREKGKGWVLHALYSSLMGLLGFDNFTDGITWIISKGGDTDTNASIAGNLMGAYYGYNEIMKDEVTRSNFDIIMNVDTTKGNNPRPHKYSPRHFDYLTSKLHEIYVHI